MSRPDQDAFAARSQARWKSAFDAGAFDLEVVPVELTHRDGPQVVKTDEHPRPESDVTSLARIKGINGTELTVTAGNSSGVNDGAAALLVASDDAVRKHDLTPMVRVVGTAAVGVAPRMMGIGPAPASQKLLDRLGLSIDRMDVIELNEAFAAQALATLRQLGVADDDPRMNAQGGAIAMGHPLGMTGARLVLTAAHQLQQGGGRYALCTMCVGVGQGTAMILERV